MSRADVDESRPLREAMITRVKDAGYHIRSVVEQALRTVPRHLFAPDAPLADAYAGDIVPVKHADNGEVLSCLSTPSIVAMQLEQLDVRPGHRVLEIGAGSGYNAALLAHLAGPAGHVTTIDVDTDIVADARRNLTAADVTNVETVCGDGALGHAPGTPYDRILATVSANRVPRAWREQLAPGGRLVMPLRIKGSATRSIAFERDPDVDRWVSVDHQLCGFVPLRDSIAGDPRATVAMHDQPSVTIHVRQDQPVDPESLHGVLQLPRADVWTGAVFGPRESVEWLYLWLTCTLDGGLCAMTAENTAVDAGIAEPLFRMHTMATTTDGGGELAYLTGRTIDHADDGSRIVEVGVIAHAHTNGRARELAEHVAAQVRRWNTDYRGHQVTITLGAPRSSRGGVRFELDRAGEQLTVDWQPNPERRSRSEFAVPSNAGE